MDGQLIANSLAISILEAVGLLVVFLLVLFVVARVLRRYRDRAEEDKEEASDLMTNFREMRSRGDLSETEYRTIKTVLATEIQDELNDAGETG